MADQIKIDMAKATTVLEGTKKDREEFKKKVLQNKSYLTSEQGERKRMNAIRQDFLLGKQGSYTNVVGLQKKEKKGHTNAAFNYAGKTVIKIYYGLANHPPNLKVPGIPVSEVNLQREALRAQGIEDFQDHIFYINQFFFHTYPRAVMNQISTGGAAVKVYYDTGSKLIKIVQKENTNNLLIGWRSDDDAMYDFVMDVDERTVNSVEKEFGIKLLKSALDYKEGSPDASESAGSHEAGYEYGNKGTGSPSTDMIPSGKTQLPKCQVIDYWDDKANMILVNGEVVQYVEHKWGFNPWVIVPNIHIPHKPWGISDIDFLIDPQIEYNEASNDERDFIRAAVNIKYVAKNMEDFDPESIKTGSGQVIFIQGDDSSFDAMPQPVNVFPAESYLNRVKKALHDLGVPEVTFGAASSNSGRSMAIDYQSLVDVIEDKRRTWTLAMNEICSRIQQLGYKYFPAEFFKNPDDNSFEVRPVQLDWSDIVPLTSSERVVNVLNKVNAGLISFKTALTELGYKDVDAELSKLKDEENDPVLSAIRNKAVPLIPGIQEATNEKAQNDMEAQAAAQEGAVAGPVGNPPQVPTPTLTTGQNRPNVLPMPTKGTSFTSAPGFINQMGQNLNGQR